MLQYRSLWNWKQLLYQLCHQHYVLLNISFNYGTCPIKMYLLFNQTDWILILTFRFIFVLLACANHNKNVSFYTILLVWRRYGSARYKNGSLYDRILFNYFLFSSLNLKDIHPYFVFTQLLLVHFHQREREGEREWVREI